MNMIALSLAIAITGELPDAHPNWPLNDVLFDCDLHRTSVPETDPSSDQSGPQARFGLFFSGSAEAPENHERRVDTFDPEELIPLAVYTMTLDWPVRTQTFDWPARIRVSMAPRSPRGPHGERYRIRHWGGAFEVLQMDRRTGTAEVAIDQFGNWIDGAHNTEPVRASYVGQCRVTEGDRALAKFRDMQE